MENLNYRGEGMTVSNREALAQALDACGRKDCAHCLYRGKGIACAKRLLADAAAALREEGQL